MGPRSSASQGTGQEGSPCAHPDVAETRRQAVIVPLTSHWTGEPFTGYLGFSTCQASAPFTFIQSCQRRNSPCPPPVSSAPLPAMKSPEEAALAVCVCPQPKAFLDACRDPCGQHTLPAPRPPFLLRSSPCGQPNMQTLVFSAPAQLCSKQAWTGAFPRASLRDTEQPEREPGQTFLRGPRAGHEEETQ